MDLRTTAAVVALLAGAGATASAQGEDWYKGVSVSAIRDSAKNMDTLAAAELSSRSHSRSKPRHRFDVRMMEGTYRLMERSDSAAGCIAASRAGDDTITVKYDYRVSERSWAPDDHFASLDVKTPTDYVLSFISDIDQGPMQYTRHDVENPSLLDIAGCLAWYAPMGLSDAYRYYKDNVLPKPQPEPDFNPSISYREITETTADNEIISERLHTARPAADVTIQTRDITRMRLDDRILTVTKQKQEGDAAPVTAQRCVYRKVQD